MNYTTGINRNSGKLWVDIPGFQIMHYVRMPQSATGFRIVATGAEIDFDGGTYRSESDSSPVFSTGREPVAPMRLSMGINKRSKHPLFVALSIQFFKLIGNKLEKVAQREYASAIVAVSQGDK